MGDKENKPHLKLKWAIPLAVVLVMGSIFLSMGTRENVVVHMPEAIHPASSTLDLSALPAMANEVNLYNENNLISVKSGSVQITHSNNQTEKVVAQSAVDVGDRILVSDDGGADIVWFDGSITRLAAGTDIKILQASYDADNINKTKIGLWAERGKIWARVINLIDGESEFSIKSTSAIAGIRGTTFNYILEDAFPRIEVVEGIIFLAKTIESPAGKNSISLTSGQVGTQNRDGTLELGKLEPGKLEEPYYSKNLEKDLLASKKFQEDNLAKIRQWAEPLPGDPGYPEKQQLIQALLSKTKDPSRLDILEARAAKIKIYEAIALSDPSKVQTTLKEVSDKIQKAEWPEAQTRDIQVKLKNDLRHIERALGSVGEEAVGPNKIEGVPHENQVQNKNDNLGQPSGEATGPASPVKTTPLEIPRPKQTEKPAEIRETIAPNIEAVPPQMFFSSRKTSPAPILTPEKKHEQVLEKIEISRKNWVKRVEEGLQKKMEEGGKSQEWPKDERGAPTEDGKTKPEKKSNPDENVIPETIETNGERGKMQNDIEKTEKIKPMENKGQGAGPSDEPKENEGQGAGPSDEPKEDRGQQENPSPQMNYYYNRIIIKTIGEEFAR